MNEEEKLYTKRGNNERRGKKPEVCDYSFGKIYKMEGIGRLYKIFYGSKYLRGIFLVL